MLGFASVAAAEPEGSQLDPGSYPRTPSPPLGLAGTPAAGARLEGQRLAGFVIGPWDVDPTLIGGFANGADVIDGPETLAAELPPELAEVVLRHNVIDGFSTGRKAADKDLRITVLRFPDVPNASAAAAELGVAAAQRVEPGGPVSPAEVPGHPDTAAVGYPFVDQDGGESANVRAFTAHGQYVVVQRAGAVSGVEDATALVAATLDRQVPLLDQFPATPLMLLPTQPLDPTGLLARSLPVAPADVTAELPGVYDARAALHFQDDPVASATLFADAGVTNWVNGSVAVYEARDRDAAQRVVDEMAATAAEFGTHTDPVAGLPDSQCMTLQLPQDGDVTGYCLAVADRYVLETYDATPAESRQKVAAQYAILTHR